MGWQVTSDPPGCGARELDAPVDDVETRAVLARQLEVTFRLLKKLQESVWMGGS
jgi:hypothetical protein